MRAQPGPGVVRQNPDPVYMSRKFESFERIISIRVTNGNSDSCHSCKRLVPSGLHELHESKFPFVTRIEIIRSKLSNFSAHVYGVTDARGPKGPTSVVQLGSSSLRRIKLMRKNDVVVSDPGYMSRKIRKFRTDKFDT